MIRVVRNPRNRIRDRKISQLTDDHTVGGELNRSAGLAKMLDHRKQKLSHVLTRAVGISSLLKTEWNSIGNAAGDKYLICSDGITTMLTEDDIERIFNEAAEPAIAVDSLAKAVMEAGAKDNFTAIAVYIGDSLPEAEVHDSEEMAENNYLIENIEG